MDPPCFRGSFPPEEAKRSSFLHGVRDDHDARWRGPPPMSGGAGDRAFTNLPLQSLSTGQGFYTIESLQGVSSFSPLLPPPQQPLSDAIDFSGYGQNYERGFPGQDLKMMPPGGSPRGRRYMSSPNSSPHLQHPQMRMPPFGLEHKFDVDEPRLRGFSGPQEVGFGDPHIPGFGGSHDPGSGSRGCPREAGFRDPQKPGFGGPCESRLEGPHRSRLSGLHELESMFEGPRESRLSGPCEPRFEGPCESRFSGPHESRFEGLCESRFSGPHESRFEGLRESRFSGPCESRFEGLHESRFSGPCKSRFEGLHESRLSGPHESRLNGPREPKFEGLRESRFEGLCESQLSSLREPRFEGPRELGFGGIHEARFKGPHDSGFGGPGELGLRSLGEAGFGGHGLRGPVGISPHPGPGLQWSRGGEQEPGQGGCWNRDHNDKFPERVGPMQRTDYGKNTNKRKFVDANFEDGTSRPPLKGKAKRGAGWCSVCKIDCKTPRVRQQHFSGKRHKRELEILAAKKTDGDGKMTEAQQDLGDNGEDDEKDELDDAFAQICEEMASVQNSDVKEEENGAEMGEPVEKALNCVDEKNLKKSNAKPQSEGVGEKLVEICDVCNVTCYSKYSFESHMGGKKHAARLKKVTGKNQSDGKNRTKVAQGAAAARIQWES